MALFGNQTIIDKPMHIRDLQKQIKTIEQYIGKYENLADIPQIEKDLIP